MHPAICILFLFPLCAAIADGEKFLDNSAVQTPVKIGGNQDGKAESKAVQPKGLPLKTRNVRIGYKKWGWPVRDKYKVKKISFTDTDDLLAKVPASDLQKSLAYQGFLPEFFNDTAFIIERDYIYAFNEDVNPEDLKSDIEIVNPKRAFEFAKRAYVPRDQAKNEANRCARMAAGNLANCYLSGIGTERNVEEAVKILKDSPLFKNGVSEILHRKCFNEEARFYYPPLIAYLHYKGIGLDLDIERCNAILLSGEYPYCWQNFYIGYLVPKDFDFAIYCLKILDEKWADEIIIKIYAGEYNPKHKDPAALKKYREYVKGKNYQSRPKRDYRF